MSALLRRWSALSILLAGCYSANVGGEPEPRDAGSATRTDAGPRDDAGDSTPDASSTAFDAGNDPLDAGTEPFDAGTPDAPDAGTVARTYPWAPAPNPPATEWFSSPPACEPNDWLAKYFEYRRRLRGDGTATYPGFIAIGTGPGHSMPSGMRSPQFGCSSHWLASTCRKPANPIANTDGFLLWGDGTVWMGWYLQALATEYEAFRILGLDTTETASDIAYALEALNRLDEAAEVPFGVTPVRDGFFLRDDVPPDFVVAPGRPPTPRFPRSDAFVGYGCIVSGASCGTVTTRDGYFVSQDQVIELMPGLALVAKLVPETVTVRGMQPGREAKAIVHRNVSFLRNNGWIIRDPTGESPPNQWGGSARPYSYVIAASANRIVQGAFGTADYQDTYSNTLGLATWTAADTSWPVQTLNNQAMILNLGVMSGDWSIDKTVRRAAEWSAPNYAMLQQVLAGVGGLPPGVSESRIEAMLTTAPCGGPCHKVSGCAEVPGWMGEHRWKSPEDRNGDVYGYDGEYNGLDYMLLHNLYVIAKAGRSELTFPPGGHCRSLPKLSLWTTNGPQPGDAFDPWDTCDARDFPREFCGRPFAAWLQAAYEGHARIFTPAGELRCSGLDPCIVDGSSRSGGSGTDLFLGTDANDAFEGLSGDDCLYGFAGNDSLSGRGGLDELHGGDGDDVLCGESCQFTDIDGNDDTIFGDDGNDTINGGPGMDAIFCGPGDDDAKGDQAEDTIFGDDGNDRLDGEMGADQLSGGVGNDTIYGGLAEDKIWAGPGRDRINSGDGDDWIDGGDGDDFLMGDAGDDNLWAGPGADRLCGGCGADFLHGGWDGDHDACREAAVNTLTCFNTQAGTYELCDEQDIAKDLCRDAAFDAWLP